MRARPSSGCLRVGMQRQPSCNYEPSAAELFLFIYHWLPITSHFRIVSIGCLCCCRRQHNSRSLFHRSIQPEWETFSPSVPGICTVPWYCACLLAKLCRHLFTPRDHCSPVEIFQVEHINCVFLRVLILSSARFRELYLALALATNHKFGQYYVLSHDVCSSHETVNVREFERRVTVHLAILPCRTCEAFGKFL